MCDEGFCADERNLLKITALTSHLNFNETCLINKILPPIKNICLYLSIQRENKFSFDLNGKICSAPWKYLILIKNAFYVK